MTEGDSTVITATTGKLNGPDFFKSLEGNVVLLRRDHDFLSCDNSSDWDVAVRDEEAFRSQLVKHFGEVIACIRRPYVTQHYYRWGQVDLLPRFIWRGNEFLKLSRFWKNVEEQKGEVARPRLAHDAFLAWMTSILAGGQFNSSHTPLILDAWKSDGEELTGCMEWAFGAGLTKELLALLEKGEPGKAVGMTRRLRRSLSFRSFARRPLSWVVRTLRHWFTEIIRHLHPPMPTLAFLGPDGSGKSSVIAGVEERLLQMRLHVHKLHWRPYGIKGREDLGTPVEDPHAEPPRGAFTSTLKLGLLFWDWWSTWLTVLLHHRSKTTVVLLDRYYYDLLIDPRRYRFARPMWLSRMVFRFLPRPDRTFVLTGDPEVIWKRKKEVSLEEVGQQISRYQALGESLGPRGHIVDVNRPLKEVEDEVFGDVEDCIRSRS